jgi:hypothetical protein
LRSDHDIPFCCSVLLSEIVSCFRDSLNKSQHLSDWSDVLMNNKPLAQTRGIIQQSSDSEHWQGNVKRRVIEGCNPSSLSLSLPYW